MNASKCPYDKHWDLFSVIVTVLENSVCPCNDEDDRVALALAITDAIALTDAITEYHKK